MTAAADRSDAGETWVSAASLLFALAVALVATSAAVGQTGSAPSKERPAADTVKQKDQELEAIRQEQKKSTDAARKLEDEIDAIGTDRRKLNQTLIDAATRARALEERIAATETRLQPLADKEKALRASLDNRRAAIAEVLAALQRMGRHPPPAVMVKADDALEAVRTAMMLGAVVPEMRQQAESLAADLTGLVRVRQEISVERDKLASDLAAQSVERQRLAALIGERQKRQSEAEKALTGERQRAADLARQAENLKDLIAKLEQGLDSPGRAARSTRNEDGRPDLAALKDPGRLAPAVTFASAKGLLPLPVSGVKIRDFGAPDEFGGSEKGISIATRSAAQVTAPCDGWVVYSAPYRSYGQLLILNAGGGYHVLLAGMERISVDVGQFVLTGEPVAVMGSGPQVASAMATGSGQPVLYIEFRKDGSPVDPAPWWVTNEIEKVRG